jgi:hypothetical protein
MTTQPVLAADIIRLSICAMFVIMTMAFAAVPRRLSNHPGKANGD